MPGLFISYRRDDQAGFAGRLADALGIAFGADTVFRDVDDIRPGDDFVDALHQQLRGIDVMLVMIGPRWLAASHDGIRRLDDAQDFVRREIQSGLESGKPVLPVLVGGATMPAPDELPAAIAALARRQAIVISDASWSADVARLVESIAPLLPRQRRRTLSPSVAWSLSAIGLIALLAVAVRIFWPDAYAPAGQTPVEPANDLSGRWTAEVNYDWGDTHEERFNLQLENGEVHGTASYLRLARGIEQGRLQAGRLSFLTHSQELLGASTREMTHRYRAVLSAGELHFVLESSGGQVAHPPVEFIARRAPR